MDADRRRSTCGCELTGADRLPQELALHIGSARTPARVRVLGPAGAAGPEGSADDPGSANTGAVVLARLTLREQLPLHVGDRVLLRDPGAGRACSSWARPCWT